MTDLSETIRNRRSIRKYAQKTVPIEVVREIVQTATYAPSAHNAQPWRFMVITDPSKKRVFAEAMAKAWFQDLIKDGAPQETSVALAKVSTERFTNAPVLLVACLTMQDMNQFPDRKRRQCEHDLAVQSLAAAIQNILLAAHDKKLGSCWYCSPIFCKEEVRNSLHLPENVEPQALITMGYPDETAVAPQRNALQDMVHLNQWGNPI